MDRYTFTFLILCGWFVFFRMFPGDFENRNHFCGTVSESDAYVSSGPMKGKIAFEGNCARCHNTRLEKEGTGPPLYGVSDRIPNGDWIYRWVANSQKLIQEGDPYAVKIWTERGKANMDPFPNLSKEVIDDIMAWIDGYSLGPSMVP
jgi:mono/diheme cytochrome c family protein